MTDRPAHQVRDVQRGRDVIDVQPSTASPVQHVATHVEVREQGPVLRHVADAPAVRRHGETAAGIDQ